MKRMLMLILFMTALVINQSYTQEVDYNTYILGYWGTSEESFEHAETSGEYVEVREDGTMRFFDLKDEGEEDKMSFDWIIEDNILKLYNDGELMIEATINIVEEGRMIWINDSDESLYLIVGAG